MVQGLDSNQTRQLRGTEDQQVAVLQQREGRQEKRQVQKKQYGAFLTSWV